MSSTNDKDPNTRLSGIYQVTNPYHPVDVDEITISFDQDLIKEIKEIIESKKRKKIILLRDNPLSKKTSLLKKIAENPRILGEKVIPAYLDILECAKVKFGDIQAAIFKKLVDNAVKHIRDSGFDWNELATYEFDYAVKHGFSFAVVFDNLDILAENYDRKTILEIFQNIHGLEESWGIFWFIFDWDERLFEYARSPELPGFFEPAYKIKIKDFVEDKNLKMLTDLLDRDVVLSLTVLREIMNVSGKSIRIQKLLFARILEYVKEKQVPGCSKKDVDAVIKKIVDDKRGEPIFHWNKRLSTVNKMLIAALADESMTAAMDKDSFYIEDEFNVLGDILGEELAIRLKKLSAAGYIQPADDRVFHKYPFRVPLYGRWIQQNHPFARTVIEHIQELAGEIDLERFIHLLEKTPVEKIVPFDKKAIIDIIKHWLVLKTELKNKGQAGVKRQHIASFFQCLVDLTGLKIKGEENSSGGDFFVIDIKRLDIGMLEDAVCIVQDRQEFRGDDMYYIENIATTLAQGAQTRITLFFSFQQIDMVENLVKKPYLSLIAIDEDELKKIILSNRPSQMFKSAILGKLSLSKVSPYHISGPARATFYGRSYIIDQIYGSANRSFIIVGARKIGKTSLLHKILDYPHPGSYYIYMDLQFDFPYAENYDAFLEKIAEEIEATCEEKVNFYGEIANFSTIIKKIAKKGKSITFIFDEVDGLLHYEKEQNFRLIRVFRAIAQKGYCRFIFAGFQELYNRKREIENPLYNFGEEILLAPLDKKAALDLITVPMKSIGVNYKADEDRECILSYTSCHPNLLQFFCKNLIKKIESHESLADKRLIYNYDINEIFDSKYEEYVIEEIYLFFSDLPPLSQLIVMLFAEDYIVNEIFSVSDTKKRLGNTGISLSIEQTRKNLKNLVMRFILEDKREDNFCFALAYFPEMLKKRIDEDFKKKVIQEVRSSVQKSL